MKKKHEHHILSQSPWPILLSLCSFFSALGAVKVIHQDQYGIIILPIGVSLTVLVLCCWWGDVILEAIRDKCFTNVVKHGLRIGLAIMILSETMFFFAFFWSFFKAWLFPIYNLVDFSNKIATSWPPEGINTVNPWSIPFFNTITLLLSGSTLTWSHHFLLKDDIKSSSRMLMYTILLGTTFLLFQFIEYTHLDFKFMEIGGKSIYSSNFYMTTGFHGIHVLLGVIFLIVCFIRMKKGQISSECHIGFECAAWYWHFIDVVWLFLFIFLYVLSS
ncbi:cytochrome c oxidase subunit 3 [Anaplasma capra]|uniref:cytochrome c oxidase subunit 3 n=1 Tax=Anaplasma capra TaxID=1562740 RepID=UPI0021D5FF30|nr:cytochrome c oxidase subunit 3 [Anaplasma capra]MCU7612306.1 cytochrome c oxidase subunit 3 [Anaplasma capra]